MTLAPVILFVYDRLDKTRETIKALALNELAMESDLVIYSDGARGSADRKNVQAVREYLKQINSFKSTRIIERSYNAGLCKSIIEGVTETVEKYGKVIVLEDDIVTSPKFLTFMNKALDYFEDKRSIWHISGWSYPIPTEQLGEYFYWRVMNCWGWATWKNRWECFDKDPKRLMSEWDEVKKNKFDLDGTKVFWPQVEANFGKKINTWAIFWYATIFEKNGLCINPAVSYVTNIGLDGSGEHSNASAGSDGNDNLNLSAIEFLDRPIEEDSVAVELVKEYYRNNRKNITTKGWYWLINKIRRIK